MISLAHVLDRLLSKGWPFLVGLALMLWLIGATSMIRAIRTRSLGRPVRPSPTFYGAATAFGLVILILIAAAIVIREGALAELRPQLHAHLERVLVNGNAVANATPLVSDLRRLQAPLIGHHSHPTTSYDVELVTSRGTVELLLRRDSGVPNEYWVYYLGFDRARPPRLDTYSRMNSTRDSST